MKEHALAIAHAAKDPSLALNSLREYLQTLILRSLNECEAFRSLALRGDTALRFLYGLPRYSEDLVFSVVADTTYAGKEWLTQIKRDLTLAGFDPHVTWNERTALHVGWVRLDKLHQEGGPPAMSGRNLTIKLEIDTRPPRGARCERRVVTRHVTLLLRHHDLPTLLAGKLFAILSQRRPKGRDWYDLIWCLTQRPPIPTNMIHLQHAMNQARDIPQRNARMWRNILRGKLVRLDMVAAAADARPFLEHPRDAGLLTRENLFRMLAER